MNEPCRSLAFLAQLPTVVTPPQDTSQARPVLPPIGKAATDVFRDSLTKIPDRVEDWVTAELAALARIVPRIAMAAIAAAAVLTLTFWVRSLIRRRPRGAGAEARVAGVGAAGALIAATLAAAIVGASTFAGALLTFALFYAAAAGVQMLGGRLIEKSRVSPAAIELLIQVARTALITLGVVEALSAIGFNLGGVIAGLGILGLAVGFAAQDTLANLIAGFTILWDRPIRLGDWVQIGDSAPGRVRHLTLRTTRIETIDAGLLIMPNKDVTGSRVFNYSLVTGGHLRLALGIAADADVEKSRRVLIELATHDARIAQSPAPVVMVAGVSDASITLELAVALPALTDARGVRAALLERALAAFRQEGMRIMEPHVAQEADKGPW